MERMDTQAHVETAWAAARARPWLLVLASAGIGLVLFLFLWRLEVYPAPWFDEGAYMNVARTLVEDGMYAERSSDGYRFNGAVISTGPTVILPIAGAYALLGVGVATGRLVMTVYGVLTLIMIFLLAQRLVPDKRYALTSLLLALFGWSNWMPLVFRTVLGEGPATFYVMAALWIWLAPGRPSNGRLIGVGLMLGLACMTKVQFVLILLPVLGIGLLLDLVWYRRLGWRWFVIPGLMMTLILAAWSVTAYLVLGQGIRDQVADMATTGSTAILSYFTFELASIGVNLLGVVSGQAYSGLFIIAFMVVGVLSLPRSEEGQRWGILAILLASSMFAYLTVAGVAPDQNRMAVPMYLFGALAMARMLFELLGRYRFSWRGAVSGARSGELGLSVFRPLLFVGFGLTLVVIPLLRAGYNVTISGSAAPYEVAHYLNEHAETDALIETWDRELTILTNHRYHLPPQIVQTYHNAHLANPALPNAGELYRMLEHVTPDYVVIGPVSRWAQLYPPAELTDYELVFADGAPGERYEVYARR